MDYQKRLNTVRAIMQDKGYRGLFLPHTEGDYEYLTGIRRKRGSLNHSHAYGDWLFGVYVNQKKAVYVVPEMHSGYVFNQLKGKPWIDECIVLKEGSDLYEACKNILRDMDMDRGTLAVPKGTRAKTLINFRRFFPEICFTCSEDFIAPLRMIKDAEEIEKMCRASRMTDEIFLDLVKDLRPGMMEIEVLSLLEHKMLRFGSDGNSFHTGVQLNFESKEKELHTLNRFSPDRLEKGCSLAFDFGIVLDGYMSDFGRTVYIGEPSENRIFAHRTVMEAQRLAIEAMKPGQITCEQADSVAREYIREQGFVNNEFYHRLGHGIGLDVHEYPYLNAGYTQVLQPGMTFTVEPSLHATSIWTRVEDIVVITENGAEKFNRAPGIDDFIIIE